MILIALAGLACVLWVGVTALSELFNDQQTSLGDRWAARGDSDLRSGRFKDAVEDFHSALRYSHDEYGQQLGLAESLLGLKRTNEAAVYLTTLWEQEPENGIVNRELARIAAGEHNVNRALRYYHNAIYATWHGNADEQRRDTRWELIKYLLSIGAKAQAQSELISLAADVGEEPGPQIDLGDYFLQVGDDSHALAAYELRLKTNPKNPQALAGAGTAAFDMGEYRSAERYLRAAAAEQPESGEIANRLQTVEAALRLNPYQRDLSETERRRVIVSAFQAAGARLQSCPAAAALPFESKNLGAAWSDLKPHLSAGELNRDPDAVSNAMNLVFEIERQASSKCGVGTPSDAALLQISRSHEGI